MSINALLETFAAEQTFPDDEELYGCRLSGMTRCDPWPT